ASLTPPMQGKRVRRLQNKVRNAVERITLYEAEGLEDADVVVISYGITSRVAQRAIELARAEGLGVGKFRLITAWPFPEHKIRELAPRVKALVVPELNLGQMVREVERAAAGECRVLAVPHGGGSVHHAADTVKVIVEASLFGPPLPIPSNPSCGWTILRSSCSQGVCSVPVCIAA